MQKGHSELYQSERKVKLKEVHEGYVMREAVPNGNLGQVEIKRVVRDCQVLRTRKPQLKLPITERLELSFQLGVAVSHQSETKYVRIPLVVKYGRHLVVPLFYEVRKDLGYRDDGVRVRMDEQYKSFAMEKSLFP